MSTQDNKGWICSVCGASNNPHQLLCAANCWKAALVQAKQLDSVIKDQRPSKIMGVFMDPQGVYVAPIDGLPGSGGYAARPE